MASAPFYVDETRPFPQRKDAMSLDIVRPKDIPKGRVMYVKDEVASLRTEDIDKARPTYEHQRYLEKPDLSVGCTDPGHAGGRARTYYAPMDRRPRDLSLTTADIEYAQPKNVRRKGNRHVDPLCPVYEMPSSVKRSSTPPRFNGRQTNDISDIEMSCPKVQHPERNYVRDPNDSHDIEFASSNYQERLQQRQGSHGQLSRSTLDVRDITEPKRLRPRCTNPLEPVYRVPINRVATSLHTRFLEEHGLGVGLPPCDAEDVGEVQGSRPRKLQWDNGEPELSLVREDIAGAVPQRWVGTVPHNIYDPPEVRSMLSFHDPQDIPGAQVGTLRKGIFTRRSCNPLNPRYALLDGSAAPPAAPSRGGTEAERGSARFAHPLLQAQFNAASLPDIHGGPNAGLLRRESSAGALRRPQATVGTLRLDELDSKLPTPVAAAGGEW